MSRLCLTIFVRYIAILFLSCIAGISSSKEPDDSLSISPYPKQKWLLTSARDVDLNPSKVRQLFDLSFQDSATQGVALFKQGMLVSEQYADGFDKNSVATSWSMEKSF